jgi:YggT family protein
MLTILFNLLFFVINLYTWLIIGVVVYSLLGSFGVLDMRNRVVWTIGDFLARATEPVLRPVRRIMPNFGAIDLSPMIVLALIQLVIVPLLARLQAAVTTGLWQTLFL